MPSTRRWADTARGSTSRCTPTGRPRSTTTGAASRSTRSRKTGLSGVEVVFTKLHAGGKFGGLVRRHRRSARGRRSVVNALSARLDVEVDRSPADPGDVLQRGVPGVFPGDGPTGRFEAKSGLHKGRRVKKGVTGTRVRFWPDRQVFTGTPRSPGRAGHAGAPDLVHRARTPAQPRSTGVVMSQSRSRSATTAGSPSSASSSVTTSRSPPYAGCRARTRSPRRSRSSTTRGT